MKIAQVSPLHESVPPQRYGGTERIVHYLTETLVAEGHDVTLFASGDSTTRARLQPVVPEALRLTENPPDALATHFLMFEDIRRRASQFDLIHCHTDYLHLAFFRECPVPVVTTCHGRLDLPGVAAFFQQYPECPLVSISNYQRRPFLNPSRLSTVYHGLPLDLYNYRSDPEPYLVFLGRISMEKRPDRAIEIALRAGIPLKIAAKIDPADRLYFDERIAPLLRRHKGFVEFVGEVNQREKDEILGGALALLFPIDWPEPFGLVMIEAMACGTPVIAFRNGSVPEVIREGISGFIVDDLDGAARAVTNLHRIQRAACRREFEERFSVHRMAEDYQGIYRRVLEERAFPAEPRAPDRKAGGVRVVGAAARAVR